MRKQLGAGSPPGRGDAVCVLQAGGAAVSFAADFTDPTPPPRSGDVFLQGPCLAASGGGAGRSEKQGWCLPNAHVLLQQLLVHREDVMRNLLIRTNYAKITPKPGLMDDTLQWEFL